MKEQLCFLHLFFIKRTKIKAPHFFHQQICINIILKNWIEWAYKYIVISAPHTDILCHWYWHYAELISFNSVRVALCTHPAAKFPCRKKLPVVSGWKCETSPYWPQAALLGLTLTRDPKCKERQRDLSIQWDVNIHSNCAFLSVWMASPGRQLSCPGVATMKTYILCALPIL